ncbi:glycoside hydrolase family 5 protein [Geodermatophilus ruber]|uniref:cellulase n=1 Tax=Geodermatophilus ruber TaxID=504800 RepID=A0A1I4LC36_9ACTN|nr:cellulase family glycosylhydrolase [Geodermatophilus ruber]SFL88574.1 Cellulase (glycosyl hydrolase family 5) [Geodermatophilus ruber]
MSHRTRWTAVAVGVLLILVVVGRASGTRSFVDSAQSPSSSPAAVTGARGHITALNVRGNQLVDQDGAPVRLLGFNNSGAEYACAQGWGIFDSHAARNTRMSASTVAAMMTWRGANTVRVPLNEQCWLGPGVQRAYGGAAYQKAIRHFVSLLRSHGFVVVLDLHRSAPGRARALEQEQMPSRSHSPDFWRGVATTFKDDTAVVFDVFNEPFPFDEADSRRAWSCWRDGGCRLPSRNASQTYTAAGMNELITTIRATGARNVIAVGGIDWAAALDRWLEYQPVDPLHNLVASFHAYPHNRCADESCFDTVLARVASVVPLYAGEVGPDLDENCTPANVAEAGFSERAFDWLDAHGASYTAWTWNVWNDCASLISDYEGTPTPFWGREVRERLAGNSE